MCEVEFSNKKYKIVLTNHLYKKRNKYYRNSLLTETAIKATILQALVNGLTSFKNKGTVKVHVMVYDGSSITLLLSIDDLTITVITALKTRHLFYTTFSKVTQSIFISTYTIPKIAPKELENHNMKNSFKRTDIEENIKLWNNYKGKANDTRLI